VLHHDKQDIYGDSIEYEMQNDTLHVLGNARFEANGDTTTGPELRLRLNDSVGEMREPVFTLNSGASQAPKPPVLIPPDNAENIFSTTTEDLHKNTSAITPSGRGNAKIMLFEGPTKKILKGVSYTTCAPGVDDWYIKAGQLELDDYTKIATAHNARIVFKGVPFLYTPWIDFSYIDQRKSGLLSPIMETSTRSGSRLGIPYYFNIAPNMDATLTPSYMSKRGLQLQGEFRYLGETYSGIDALEYLPDDGITNRSRYYAKFSHRQSLGSGWSAGYDFEKVSDNQYFSDLTTRITSTSRVILPQQAYINWGNGTWNFGSLIQKYQTLDGTSYPYERLPQFTLTSNKRWGMVNTDFYSQWVRFDTDANAPKNLVKGSRLTVYPSISLPLVKPYGFITPKFGVNYTSYSLDNANVGNYASESRTLPIFSLDSGLYFERDMRVVKNTYTQTLEPRLFYVYIPYKDQSRLPVFDSSLYDLSLGSLFLENQYVGNDRINDANQLNMAVTTRIIDAKTGEQRLAATLGQRYYFSDQKVSLPGQILHTGSRSEIITALTAHLINHWDIDTRWQYDSDRGNTTRSDISARYSPEPGKVLNLTYRYTESSLEQVNFSAQWQIARNWYGLGRWNYSLREKHAIEGLAGIEYDAGCWQARFVMQSVSTATANTNTAMFFQLVLNGVGSIDTGNPLTLIRRSIPGYTNPNLIPDRQPYNE
jgi:LPS-assembly protein